MAMQSTGLSVQELKLDFQDGDRGGYLGCPFGMILAIFNVQVAPILPTKFRVNLPFRIGEEIQNRFSRWLLWRSAGIYFI